MPASRSLSVSALADQDLNYHNGDSVTSCPDVDHGKTKGSTTYDKTGSVPNAAKGSLVRSTSQPALAATKGLTMLSPYVKHAVSLHPSRSQKTVKRKKIVVTANLAATKYSLVRRVCLESGMVVSDSSSTNECLLIWSDSAVSAEIISELKSYQKINHFPGMGEICRKDNLARNLTKMARTTPDEYNFFPKTWIFPGDYTTFNTLNKELKKRKKYKTYIVKPANGAMGHGIWLTRNCERLHPYENYIVQEYIDKPLLMDGYKFDLRLYVLVTSCDPLRVYLYNDGLVRMSTERYQAPCEANLDCQFMHLTNYSINKHSEGFINTTEDDLGTKRTLKHFMDWIKEHDENFDQIWSDITDVIVKTLLIAEPHVFHAYHMCRPSDPLSNNSVCFEILGFDILLDRKFRPWVIEINRAPSFGTDQALDFNIKRGVLSDALKLLDIRVTNKRRGLAAEKAEARSRLTRPLQRQEQDLTASQKRKKILQRRKCDLRKRLAELRKDAALEDHEKATMGNYRRIYPPYDRVKLERYKGILESAAKVITGRPTLRRGGTHPFQSLKEHEVLDLLEQVENDENGIELNERSQSGFKPLSSLPSSKSIPKSASNQDLSQTGSSKRPVSAASSPSRSCRSSLAKTNLHRPPSHRALSSGTTPSLRSLASVENLQNCDNSSEKSDEYCRQTLKALHGMRIKFPGKTDEEAEKILTDIQENWKYHKPRVATYWLVKLDTAKRRKVIDIVKGNVRAIIQRIWKIADLDSLHICRTFTKLFNRLLWSHGQGLWSCYNTVGETWESIFNKNADPISQVEMNCCRRVVQLCKDCLLVVYQFASESRLISQVVKTDPELSTMRPKSSIESKKSGKPSSTNLLSVRLARLYKGDT